LEKAQQRLGVGRLEVELEMGLMGLFRKGTTVPIYTYINLNGKHDFRKSLNLASPIFLKNQGDRGPSEDEDMREKEAQGGNHG
jgi:hypothetical protein